MAPNAAFGKACLDNQRGDHQDYETAAHCAEQRSKNAICARQIRCGDRGPQQAAGNCR